MTKYNYQIEKDHLVCEPRAALALMGLVFEKSDNQGIDRIQIVMGIYAHEDEYGRVCPMFDRKFVDWVRNGCKGLSSGEYVLMSSYDDIGSSSKCADWCSEMSAYPKIKATKAAYEKVRKLSLQWEENDEEEWFTVTMGFGTNDPSQDFCDVYIAREFKHWLLNGDKKTRPFVMQHSDTEKTDRLQNFLMPVTWSMEE
jgi:hypothetical protein